MFARNVLGLEDADHAETNPDAKRLVVTRLACSLVGLEQRVTIVPGTRAAALYGADTAVEDFRCNYGVDSAYHATLEQAGLRLSGFGEDGELRIIELPAHPFFLATLFVPQMRSTPERPHPVLAAFARAVQPTLSACSRLSHLCPTIPPRAWQHPWLRVSRLIRCIRETHWSAETWPKAKAALGWALAELGRLRRSAWWN